MPFGIADVLRVVDREARRQRMQHGAAVARRMRAGRLEHAMNVGFETERSPTATLAWKCCELMRPPDEQTMTLST